VGLVDKKLAEIGTAVEFQAERTRLAFAAGMAQTQRSLRITGALSRPVVRNAVNYGSGGRLVGWSVRAEGGPVTCYLRDGHDASGDIIAIIDLVDTESETLSLGRGISFVESLYVHQAAGAGALVGAVWLGAVD